MCNFHLVTCSAFSGKHTVSKLTLSYYIPEPFNYPGLNTRLVRRLKYTYNIQHTHTHTLAAQLFFSVSGSMCIRILYSVELQCDDVYDVYNIKISYLCVRGVILYAHIYIGSDNLYGYYIRGSSYYILQRQIFGRLLQAHPDFNYAD